MCFVHSESYSLNLNIINYRFSVLSCNKIKEEHYEGIFFKFNWCIFVWKIWSAYHESFSHWTLTLEKKRISFMVFLFLFETIVMCLYAIMLMILHIVVYCGGLQEDMTSWSVLTSIISFFGAWTLQRRQLRYSSPAVVILLLKKYECKISIDFIFLGIIKLSLYSCSKWNECWKWKIKREKRH